MCAGCLWNLKWKIDMCLVVLAECVESLRLARVFQME